MAQGRVWTGAQAHERGLVDRLGGLDVAIAAAKERAGIDADDDVEVVVYPHRRTVYEAFSDQFGGSGVTGVLSAILGRGPAQSRGRRHRAGASLPPRGTAGAHAVCVREVGTMVSSLRSTGLQSWPRDCRWPSELHLLTACCARGARHRAARARRRIR